uniref:Uncharacterized protein n=1 Tax=Heliothis virescens TaxID=7102 RepID=A0A2A4JCI8_HELVI
MKGFNNIPIFLTLAVGLGTLAAEVNPKNCLEAQVLDLLSKWQNGDEGITSSVPSLENISLKSVDGVFEGFGIRISYTTGEMQLRGVNNFTVEQLSVSTSNLEASTTLHFPLLSLTADQYNLQGRAYLMYSLKGTGLMNATFQNVEVSVGSKLVTNNTVMQVDDVNLNFSVGSIKVDLANSSWPINKVLNSSAMKIVENHRQEIVSAAKDMLKQVVNDYLATMTSSQLLSIAANDYCSFSLTSLAFPK